MSLALLERVSCGLYRQILFVHIWDASFRVREKAISIVSFLFSVLPLSIGNDIDAVLNIVPVIILLRFYESQFYIVSIELLVRNSVAGCSKQDFVN